MNRRGWMASVAAGASMFLPWMPRESKPQDSEILLSHEFSVPGHDSLEILVGARGKAGQSIALESHSVKQVEGDDRVIVTAVFRPSGGYQLDL